MQPDGSGLANLPAKVLLEPRPDFCPRLLNRRFAERCVVNVAAQISEPSPAPRIFLQPGVNELTFVGACLTREISPQQLPIDAGHGYVCSRRVTVLATAPFMKRSRLGKYLV